MFWFGRQGMPTTKATGIPCVIYLYTNQQGEVKCLDTKLSRPKFGLLYVSFY